MSNRLKSIAQAALLFFLVFTVPSCEAPELAASSAPSISSLELKDLNGQTVKLPDYRGKVVVLNFWATWCPPCLMELPHFKEEYEEFEGRNIAFWGRRWTRWTLT
jgi:thiol-disulfide isomerase/thioredoxin